VAQHLLCLSYLGGHGSAELVYEVEQAAAVDDDGGTDGQASRLADEFLQPIDEM
jgi:hypothetical protein